MWGRIPILRTFGAGAKPWTRSDKIAAAAATCTVVLAVATVVQTQVNSAKEPNLQVAVVSARLSEEIDATDENMNGIVLRADHTRVPADIIDHRYDSG